MAELLYPFGDDNFHTQFGRQSSDFDFLWRQKKCEVALSMVTLHVSHAVGRGPGLFDLLCDAPIQLVDTSDAAILAKFHRLWMEYPSRHGTEPTSFFTFGSDPELLEFWEVDICHKASNKDNWWVA
ncbi:hypothetical protein B0H67DRAFT_552269 [Lasiosphaeris hirsuta]|uniref:Uncharacterized protein n=1 Tax=Lasiosphaeris hirsuta TaxID=260670 RepID=A0AA40AQ88_9PEZI|nr:hypothetical protein B0H67DRAFT_552269 [Lasiosphaeris hirsuta]